MGQCGVAAHWVVGEFVFQVTGQAVFLRRAQGEHIAVGGPAGPGAAFSPGGGLRPFLRGGQAVHRDACDFLFAQFAE